MRVSRVRLHDVARGSGGGGRRESETHGRPVVRGRLAEAHVLHASCEIVDLALVGRRGEVGRCRGESGLRLAGVRRLLLLLRVLAAVALLLLLLLLVALMVLRLLAVGRLGRGRRPLEARVHVVEVLDRRGSKGRWRVREGDGELDEADATLDQQSARRMKSDDDEERPVVAASGGVP